ncbi:MAG: ATP-binding protein [Leptospirillia bacterium]
MASPRILIVDDSPEDREFYRRLLQQEWGTACTFLEAETVEEGLTICRDSAPDCVLLDYSLPDGDGIEFLTRLRHGSGTPMTPIVMLTGHGSESIAVEAMKEGARDYLIKGSLTAKAISRSVGNAIEKGQLARALHDKHVELERANRDLVRKNREIQSFYHTVSHELKTPMTVIREFSMIMIDGIAGELSEEQRSYLHIIRRNCDQMTVMVNDLLDSSRLENGKLSIYKEPCSIGALIESVASEIQPIMLEGGIELSCDVQPDLPEVALDSSRMRQVLDNLLSNAAKFTPPGGRVEVRAEYGKNDDENIRISVTDSGKGMEKTHLEYVFDRFYQVGDRHTEGTGGLGLGLNICKGIVDLHGGSLEVTSEPGYGSTFSFTLPVHD